MTFWQRLASRFRPQNAGSLSVSSPDVFIRYPWMSEAGVPITTETAIQVSAVYGCCRIIVDSLAAAPIRVYEVKPKGVREILHDDPTSYTLNWGAPVDKAPDAPSSQAIEEALFWSALLTGNGYAEIQRDGADRFFGLWPLESDRVTPKRAAGGEPIFEGDRAKSGQLIYEIGQPEGGVVNVLPSRIFHLRGPSLYGWVGASTVYYAAKAIGIAQASQVFAAAYMASGTVLSGYLKTPKVLVPDQQKRMGESWKQNYSGPNRAGGTPVLHSGMEYVPITHDAQKAQLVEGRRFQVAEVARFFGVPTTLLADNEAWTNLTEIYQGFYRNALLPWAERFDAEATRKLFPMRQPWREVGHDLTQLVMGSFKERVEALRSAVNGGLKTRNEARAILGDNTIGPDGDVLVIEGSVKSLEDVLDPPEPPAPKALPPGDKPDEEGGDGGEMMKPKPPPVPKRPEANLARMAVALDRFARKLEQRRKDVERKAPDKVEENLAALRSESIPVLLDECRKAAGCVDNIETFEDAVLKAADAVIAGEPAHLAANRMVKP